MGKDNNLVRKYRICIKFNEKELKVIDKYCKKYNIENRSRFIREAVMKAIIEQMVEQDYPKLFDDITVSEDQDGDVEIFGEETFEQQTGTDTQIEHPKLFD